MNIKELKNRGLQLRAIHDHSSKSLQKNEGMEVIVPEEKDKSNIYWNMRVIEKEENEQEYTSGRTAGECSEF